MLMGTNFDISTDLKSEYAIWSSLVSWMPNNLNIEFPIEIKVVISQMQQQANKTNQKTNSHTNNIIPDYSIMIAVPTVPKILTIWCSYKE